nr:immunoglobulin light chain junction region [Macaca mulatta]MOW53349.1 immunoglobulin light chain junction region [Macaca mulatta]MOW55121.1 immunoglobulin light chain junction region [Macaca mulatta]
CQQESRWSLTF